MMNIELWIESGMLLLDESSIAARRGLPLLGQQRDYSKTCLDMQTESKLGTVAGPKMQDESISS